MQFRNDHVVALAFGLLLAGTVGCPPEPPPSSDAGEEGDTASSDVEVSEDTGDVAPSDADAGEESEDTAAMDVEVSSETGTGDVATGDDGGSTCDGEFCAEVTVEETVAEEGNWVDLALDAEGGPHVVYNTVSPEQGVRYAERTDGTWSATLIDGEGDVGEGASIAVDSDAVHVAYNDETDGEVRYATSADGSSWDLETVASVGEDGYQTSTVLDADGRPHVAYVDGSENAMKHAVRDGGSWSTEEVGSATPGFIRATNSMAVDASGMLHLTYDDSASDELRYARGESGDWTVESVASIGGDGISLGTYNSLEVLDGGEPVVSFGDEVADSLNLASRSDENWETQVIDDQEEVGLHTSLAVDSDGTRLISYYDSANDDLKFASVTDSETRTQTLLSDGNVGFSTRLAVDEEGAIHLVFAEQNPWTVRYAVVER